jgi:hypothetical protein
MRVVIWWDAKTVKLLLSKHNLLTQSICHVRIGGTIWDCRMFTSISGPLMGTFPPSPLLQSSTLFFLSLGNHSESYYGNQCEIYRTEANGCLPCVRVTRACSKQTELLPRYITLFHFRFVTQDSEMMAIKCIERNMRIHRLQDRNKIVYICGSFIIFLFSNPNIDDLLYMKYSKI